MNKASLLSVMAASLWLTACADGIGPPSGRPGQDRALHHLRWLPDLGSPSFATVHGASGFEGFQAPSEPEVQILDTYQTSFWARRSSTRGVEIRYQAADGTWQPYVRLTVPSLALKLWPDGRQFTDRDSVLITLALDSTQLVVQLQPTGLVFDDKVPARLDVWYTGADPDLDGSGAVDANDNNIELNLLGVWVQEGANAPWAAVTSVHLVENKLFTAGLKHFSHYAVSH